MLYHHTAAEQQLGGFDNLRVVFLLIIAVQYGVDNCMCLLLVTRTARRSQHRTSGVANDW